MGGAVRAQESLVTQLGATADARATIQSLRKRVAELEGAEAQRSQRARDTLLAANRYREAAGRGDFFPTLVELFPISGRSFFDLRSNPQIPPESLPDFISTQGRIPFDRAQSLVDLRQGLPRKLC